MSPHYNLLAPTVKIITDINLLVLAVPAKETIYRLVCMCCAAGSCMANKAVLDSGFVNLTGAGFDDTSPAGAGSVICSWNCLNSMDIHNVRSRQLRDDAEINMATSAVPFFETC